MLRAEGSSGTARSIRNRSASFPVFTMPSSVSKAPAEVTTHGGYGCGPRDVGTTAVQVDQRWSGPGSNPESVGRPGVGSRGKSSTNTVVNSWDEEVTVALVGDDLAKDEAMLWRHKCSHDASLLPVLELERW